MNGWQEIMLLGLEALRNRPTPAQMPPANEREALLRLENSLLTARGQWRSLRVFLLLHAAGLMAAAVICAWQTRRQADVALALSLALIAALSGLAARILYRHQLKAAAHLPLIGLAVLLTGIYAGILAPIQAQSPLTAFARDFLPLGGLSFFLFTFMARFFARLFLQLSGEWIALQ